MQTYLLLQTKNMNFEKGSHSFSYAMSERKSETNNYAWSVLDKQVKVNQIISSARNDKQMCKIVDCIIQSTHKRNRTLETRIRTTKCTRAIIQVFCTLLRPFLSTAFIGPSITPTMYYITK